MQRRRPTKLRNSRHRRRKIQLWHLFLSFFLVFLPECFLQPDQLEHFLHHALLHCVYFVSQISYIFEIQVLKMRCRLHVFIELFCHGVERDLRIPQQYLLTAKIDELHSFQLILLVLTQFLLFLLLYGF